MESWVLCHIQRNFWLLLWMIPRFLYMKGRPFLLLITESKHGWYFAGSGGVYIGLLGSLRAMQECNHTEFWHRKTALKLYRPVMSLSINCGTPVSLNHTYKSSNVQECGQNTEPYSRLLTRMIFNLGNMLQSARVIKLPSINFLLDSSSLSSESASISWSSGLRRYVSNFQFD